MTTRSQMLHRIVTLKEEIQSYLDDVDHWNRIYPRDPIDADPDGRIMKMLRALNAALAREQHDDQKIDEALGK